MMMRAKRELKQRLDALRRVAVFADCTDEELQTIDSLITEITVPPGKALVREGEAGLEFMVVVEGEADVTREGDKIASIGPGSFIGEMALLDKAPRSATVTAATEMELFVLTIGEFFSLLNESPAVKDKIVGAAERRRDQNETTPC
jgi:CRP-like cAMP-binding protein